MRAMRSCSAPSRQAVQRSCRPVERAPKTATTTASRITTSANAPLHHVLAMIKLSGHRESNCEGSAELCKPCKIAMNMRSVQGAAIHGCESRGNCRRILDRHAVGRGRRPVWSWPPSAYTFSQLLEAFRDAGFLADVFFLAGFRVAAGLRLWLEPFEGEQFQEELLKPAKKVSSAKVPACIWIDIARCGWDEAEQKGCQRPERSSVCQVGRLCR